MQVPRAKREIHRRLRLDKGIREAFADHLRFRWPAATAVSAAHAYGFTLDRAREAVGGRASLTTIEAAIKSPEGGWPLLLWLGAEVIGQTIESWLNHQRDAYADQARRFAQVLGLGGYRDPDRVRDAADAGLSAGGRGRASARRVAG